MIRRRRAGCQWRQSRRTFSPGSNLGAVGNFPYRCGVSTGALPTGERLTEGIGKMKRYGVMAGVATGVAALAAAGSVLLGTTQPSSAAVTQQPVKLTAAQSSTSITFVKRYFERKYPHGYLSNAVLPKTWREVHIGPHETRFDDTAHSRMIRFNTWWGPETPQSALKRKVAALKGT